MQRDISHYCVKFNCGKCCERGWDIFVSQDDMNRWKEKKPEILTQITSKMIDGKERKLLKKRPVKFPNGKIRDLCVFYDIERKCLIHEFNPQICRKFNCFNHPFFIFQLFTKISELVDVPASKKLK